MVNSGVLIGAIIGSGSPAGALDPCAILPGSCDRIDINTDRLAGVSDEPSGRPIMHRPFLWLPALASAALGVAPAAAFAQAEPRRQAVAPAVVADGRTDDTAALQKALDDDAAAGGGVVDLPSGRLRIDGKCPSEVRREGQLLASPTPRRYDGACSQVE
jgi:hypothetical protein